MTFDELCSSWLNRVCLKCLRSLTHESQHPGARRVIPQGAITHLHTRPFYRFNYFDHEVLAHTPVGSGLPRRDKLWQYTVQLHQRSYHPSQEGSNDHQNLSMDWCRTCMEIQSGNASEGELKQWSLPPFWAPSDSVWTRQDVSNSASGKLLYAVPPPVYNGCVRLASPGWPRCVAFYFGPGRTCADNYPRLSWKKKKRHTPGSTQG